MVVEIKSGNPGGVESAGVWSVRWHLIIVTEFPSCRSAPGLALPSQCSDTQLMLDERLRNERDKYSLHCTQTRATGHTCLQLLGVNVQVWASFQYQTLTR